MKFKFEEKIIDDERYIKFNNKFEEFRYKFGNWLIVLLILVLAISFICLMIYVLPYIKLLKTNPCQLCMEQGYQCMKLKWG